MTGTSPTELHDDCVACPSMQRGLCQGLSQEVRHRLMAAGRVVDYPADRLLWDEGRAPTFVGVVTSGFLRMVRYSIEGRRQITVIVPPGDIIGENFDTPMGYSLETATPVRICRMERGVFLRMMEDNPALGRAFYRQCVDRLDGLRRATWSFGLQSPEERFCSFLAEMKRIMPFQPIGRGGLLHVAISRADIADYLGTTRETISRIAHKLNAVGLIEIRNPATFYIPDMDRLVGVGTSRRSWRPRAHPAAGGKANAEAHLV